jgi:hypothetical protein
VAFELLHLEQAARHVGQSFVIACLHAHRARFELREQRRVARAMPTSPSFAAANTMPASRAKISPSVLTMLHSWRTTRARIPHNT